MVNGVFGSGVGLGDPECGAAAGGFDFLQRSIVRGLFGGADIGNHQG